MGRTAKSVPIEDHLKMCEMRKQGSGPRIIAREFNGAYHPSHVTRLLVKCPELVDSHAGREAVANVLAAAQTLSSPNLSTSINPTSSLGEKLSVQKRQRTEVKNLANPANSVWSPALGGDDDGDEDDDESDENDFDSLNYDTLTPIPTQTSSLFPGLINPFIVFQRTAADAFNAGVIQTASQLYDKLSRRLFPNLYPDISHEIEVGELKDLIDKQNLKRTTSNLENAGASHQPQTCTGYCEVGQDERNPSSVDGSRQLKGSGINSNVTLDQSAQEQTFAPNSQQQILVGKKASDIEQPLIPLEIPDVISGNMSSSDLIAASTRTDCPLAEQDITAQGESIERKSFIVTQSNGLRSESVNHNAEPQEETTSPSHPTKPSPAILAGSASGDPILSISVVQPLNVMQTFTPALLNVEDPSSNPVLPGVTESQIGKVPPAVIGAVKSEFSSQTLPLWDVPVEPKAINQTVSRSSLNDTKQNSLPVTSQESTEAEQTEELCERNQTAGKIDPRFKKGENDAPWWLPLALGVAAVLGVTYLERVLKPQQSIAPISGTSENIDQIHEANYIPVLGPSSPTAKKPPSALYGSRPENNKTVF